MNFNIKYQEEYSRAELLLRTFFGFIYIAIPHYIGLMIFGIVAYIYAIIATLAVLFTGKYPRSMFDFRMKLSRWGLRVTARLYNLSDGYPAWGMDGTDDKTTFEVPYPEKLNWGLQWIKALFGFFYVVIPHGIVLYLRLIVCMIMMFIAWFAVLFTGKYPKNMFDFIVGTLRWGNRVGLYMGFMSDTYPPFTAELQEGEQSGSSEKASNEEVLDA